MHIFKNKFLSFSSTALVIALLITPLSAGKPNKESFIPNREVFSQSADIDYPRLQAHLHYSFKDTNLLRDALHPMLPKKLNSSEQQFEQLEFLGDSVLELIVIKRLIDLFPKEDRGHLDQIRRSLVKNKTLTETFLWNLDLEQYLPFPNKPYKICDVAEAIIGAIYKDDAQNGMNNATTFVMRLLDEEIINKKISEYLGQKRIVFTPKMLPEQETAISDVCTPARIKSHSPKSLLNEVLLKIFDDRPEYITSLKKTDDGRIRFSSNVIGAQIGKKISGLGNSVQEAEENAARSALNALAQNPLYDIRAPQNSENNFRYQLSEIVKFLGIIPTASCVEPIPSFNYQISLDGSIIGKGEGRSKAEAEENAAQNALNALAQNPLYNIRVPQNSGNNFRAQLNDITQSLGIIPTASCVDLIAPFNYQFNLDGCVIGKGEGKNKSDAEENAAQAACHFLAQREEKRQQTRQDIRLSELKKKRETPMVNQPLPLAVLAAATPVEQKPATPATMSAASAAANGSYQPLLLSASALLSPTAVSPSIISPTSPKENKVGNHQKVVEILNEADSFAKNGSHKEALARHKEVLARLKDALAELDPGDNLYPYVMGKIKTAEEDLTQQEVMLSELMQKRETPMVNQPLPLAGLSAATPVEPSSLKKPAVAPASATITPMPAKKPAAKKPAVAKPPSKPAATTSSQIKGTRK